MLAVTSTGSKGLRVSGMCMPVILAPFADEIVVCGGTPLQVGQGQHAVAFATPVATPGLTVVCRERYGHHGSTFDHPLATRFESFDAMVPLITYWYPGSTYFYPPMSSYTTEY